jgi:hypothetical protein
VRSSTSRFDRGVPRGNWGRIWLTVLVVVVAFAIRYERFLRSRGYHPSVKDDEYAWAWERGRVSDRNPTTVALVGSSRIMLDFSVQTFAETLPNSRYDQLGVNGTTPMATLLDLSRDPDFRGIAIVDVSERAFNRAAWHAQQDYVDTYHRRGREIGAMAERWLATQIQSRLALLSTRGVVILDGLWRNGAWPKPPYVTTHADRTRYADFTLTDLETKLTRRLAKIETWEDESPDRKEWLDNALAIEPAVSAIQARGGKVVYVRMPTCDELWDADERMFPKALFWDQLAARTHAVAIHFKDDAELASFQCPDTSHLDARDAPAFTRALLRILRARGVFD